MKKKDIPIVIAKVISEGKFEESEEIRFDFNAFQFIYLDCKGEKYKLTEKDFDYKFELLGQKDYAVFTKSIGSYFVRHIGSNLESDKFKAMCRFICKELGYTLKVVK